MSWHYKKDYHLPLLIKSYSSPVTSSMSPPLRLTILHRNENGFINSSTLFPLKSTYFWFNIMEWETYLLPAGESNCRKQSPIWGQPFCKAVTTIQGCTVTVPVHKPLHRGSGTGCPRSRPRWTSSSSGGPSTAWGGSCPPLSWLGQSPRCHKEGRPS